MSRQSRLAQVSLKERIIAPGLRRSPIALSFATTIAIQGVNVITGIILARNLGPSGRGELTAVLLWPTILGALGTLGVPDAATYYSARRVALGKLVVSVAILGVAQSTVICLLGLLVIPRILAHYGLAAVHSGELFLVYVPLWYTAIYLQTIFNGLGRWRWFQGLRLLPLAVSGLGLVILVIADDLNTRNAVAVYLAGYATTALVAIGLLHTAKPVDMKPQWAPTKNLVKFGLKSYLSSASRLLNERLDQLILSIVLPSVTLGLYAVAFTVTSLTGMIGLSVAFVALPAVTKAEGPAKLETGKRYISLTFLSATLLTAPILLLAPGIIRLVFGGAFENAAGPARILLVATVVYSVGRVVDSVLKGANRPLDAGIAEVVALAVMAAGLAALVPLFELTGAAMASMLAYSVSTVWMLRRAATLLEVSMVDLLIPSFLLPTGNGVGPSDGNTRKGRK